MLDWLGDFFGGIFGAIGDFLGISEAVEGAINGIMKMMSDWLVGSVDFCLKNMSSMFNASVDVLKENIATTPTEFSDTMTTTLKTLSDNVLLPIAGIIITYIFCYEVYTLVTNKNKGDDFEIGGLLFLIIKTALMISLVTNAFNISLAFADVGKWAVEESVDTLGDSYFSNNSSEMRKAIIDSISPEAYMLDENGKKTDIKKLKEIEKGDSEESLDDYKGIDFKLGQAFIMVFISLIALIAVMIMVGIIYVVAYSRIVMVLLYCAVAPLPMSTLMNTDWIGSIGQNYVKNLLALMLQGFLMIVVLVIYQGLLTNGITTSVDNPLMLMTIFLVSMIICVKMLMGTHGLAKSITGAS